MFKASKYILLILLLAIPGFQGGIHSQEEPPENLLVNPGGEEDTEGAWEIFAGTWEFSGEVSPNTGEGYFAATSASSEEFAIIGQFVDVTQYADAIDAGAQRVLLEAQYQTTAGGDPPGVAGLLIAFADSADQASGQGLGFVESPFRTSTRGWQRLEIEERVPPGTRGIAIGLLALPNREVNGPIYFDDVALIALEPVPFEATCTDQLPGATAPDTKGCPTEFDPFDQLTFDDSLHEAWYGRFWTGSCAGVNAFCISGPGWYETIDILLGRLPEAEHAYARNRMWALGRAVGHDWARDNRIDAIATSDIQAWGGQLERAQSPAEIYFAITQIEDEVCRRLGEDYIVGGYAEGSSCATVGD